MKVIVLGSGTYQPELNRHCASYLLQAGNQNIVFDFGRGAIDQLLKVGVPYWRINHVFITHSHADHWSELPALIQISLTEPPRQKKRKEELHIYGPRGIKRAVQHLFRAFGVENSLPPYSVGVTEINNGDHVRCTHYQVTGYLVRHSLQRTCLAYRIKTAGKVLAYSGDSTDCSGLRRAVKNADLAIIEASWPQGSASHLSAASAARIAQESGVKKLVLTHISPTYWRSRQPLKDAKKEFAGPLFLASDLKSFTL